MLCMVCGVSMVELDSRSCSPLVDVDMFKARIYGKGGGREIVEFSLYGLVIYQILTASCWSVCSGTTWWAV